MAWVNVKWISVKEQLPESEDYVLTYMGGKYGLGLIRMGRYRNNNWNIALEYIRQKVHMAIMQ